MRGVGVVNERIWIELLHKEQDEMQLDAVTIWLQETPKLPLMRMHLCMIR